MFRFGEFTFDPASGELRRGGRVTRLTPQSAQILLLLLERAGDVVARAEVRDRVWPDTTVEFDQGLSFCIRQLRIALDDDAAKPTFIETLPRRGYRFLATVSDDDPAPPAAAALAPAATQSPSASPPARRWRTVAGIAAVLAVCVALVAWQQLASTRAPVRLAVVPFDADTASPELAEYRDALAEAIVERTTSQARGSIAVLGPSTTRGFGSRTIIDTIRARTGATYALSGVVRRRGNGWDTFAQLIRASDRAHVWAFRWSDSSTAPGGERASLGVRIADSVAAILLSPEPRRALRR